MNKKQLKPLSMQEMIASKQKKIYLTFGVIFLSIVCLFTYQIITSYQMTIRQSKINSSNLSFVLEQYIAHNFNNADYGLLKVKEYAEDKVKSGLKLEKLNLDNYLIEQGKLIPSIGGFRISNKDGFIIYPSNIPADAKKTYDREYFQVQKADPNIGRFISKPILGRISKKLGVVLSRRINDK